MSAGRPMLPWLPSYWPQASPSGNWWVRNGLRVRYVQLTPHPSWRVLLTETNDVLCTGCGRVFPLGELGDPRSAHRDAGPADRMRSHEIAKLRGEDFDLAAGWLMVTGKGGVTKPIPIHPEVAKLAAEMPEIGLWFPSPVKPTQPVAPAAVSNTIRTVLRSCGSNATAHQLRDTAATRMQRKVKDIRLTQSMLRHRMVVTTQKYTEASNEDLQDAVLALDWADEAQAHIPAPERPAAPVNVAAMSRAQMAALAVQLLTALSAENDV